METIDVKANEWCEQGLRQLLNGDVHGSIHAFSKAIFLTPNEPDYYTYRAESYLNLSDFPSALLNYRKAYRLDPKNDAISKRLGLVHFYIGRLHMDADELQQAVASFAEAHTLDPGNQLLWIQRVKVYLRTTEYDKALIELDKVIDNPDSNPLISSMMLTEQGSKVYEYQQPEFTKEWLSKEPRCGDLNMPTMLEAIYLRAKVRLVLNEAELAQPDVGWLHSIIPSHPQVRELLDTLMRKAEYLYGNAMAHVLASNHRQAIRDLSRAIELDPNQIQVYRLRATVFRTLGDYDAALSDLKIALAICLQLKANEEFLRKQKQEEIEREEKVRKETGLIKDKGEMMTINSVVPPSKLDGVDTELEHQLAITFNSLALEYFAEKKYPHSISCLSKAIELSPKVTSFYINRGDSFRSLEEYERALADYHQARELEDNEAEKRAINARLSVVHNELGRRCFNDTLYKSAEVQFSRAIHFNNRVGHFYANRANTYFRLSRFVASYKDYQKALKLDPSLTHARVQMHALEANILNPLDRAHLTIPTPQQQDARQKLKRRARSGRGKSRLSSSYSTSSLSSSLSSSQRVSTLLGFSQTKSASLRQTAGVDHMNGIRFSSTSKSMNGRRRRRVGGGGGRLVKRSTSIMYHNNGGGGNIFR